MSPHVYFPLSVTNLISLYDILSQPSFFLQWIHYVVLISCFLLQIRDLRDSYSSVFFFLSKFLSLSDYIIKEKTVLLQKKDNEGFGFVLRGAKGEPVTKSLHNCDLIQSHILSSLLFLAITLTNPPLPSPYSLFYVPSCSPDSHRGVHTNAGVPRAAVPGVCRWGGRGVESWPQNGGFPHRGKGQATSNLMWGSHATWYLKYSSPVY